MSDPANALAILRGLAEPQPDAPAASPSPAQRMAELKRSAEACRARQDFASAVRLLQMATELDPDDAEALFLLATTLYRAGRTAAALDVMCAARALTPDNIAVLANLGRILLDLDHNAEAEKVLRRGLELAPNETAILRSLAILTRDGGRATEALAFWRRLLAIRPDDAEARYNLSRESGFQPDEAEVRAIEAASRRADGPMDRAMLAFALFRAHETHGRPAEAFRWLDASNKAIRTSFRFDPAVEPLVFEQMKLHFHKASSTPPARYDGIAPIFIVGMPRSGTSLAEQILASHPLVFGGGERNTVTTLVGALLSDRRRPGLQLEGFGAEHPTAAEMRGRYLAEHFGKAGDKSRFTDKMPLNFRWVGIIKAMFPDARIVHCTRSPIETCMSIYASIFGGSGNRFAYDLVELGDYYVAYAHLMEHWQTVFGTDDLMQLDLEQLKADQKGETRRLLDFCRLDWEPRCLAFEKTERAVKTLSATQVHQGLYRSRDRRTGMFRPFLKPLEDILVAGGIDPDEHWRIRSERP